MADGEGLISLCYIPLGSFAAQTGILPSAFRLRVEPPMRVFFIPTNPGQIKNVPLGHLIFMPAFADKR